MPFLSTRIRAFSAIAGLAALVLASPRAHAQQDPIPPGGGGGLGADSFIITYWLTNDEGELERRMTLQDLQQFNNQARCLCGQKVGVEIGLADRNADNVQLQTVVGNNCAQAETPASQFQPCAILNTAFTETFRVRQTFKFHPLWLHTGVAPGSPRNIDEAMADQSCSAAQGTGGVWMCDENSNGSAGCQSDEYFITGTTNNNVPMGTDPQGVAYDFTPPIARPTGVEVIVGDGAAEVSWDLQDVADIAGFRIMCARDGEPVEGKGIDAPDLTREHNGDIYYTAGDLCPDGVFSENPGPEVDDDGSGGGDGETGGTDTGTGGTDTGTGGTDTGTGGTDTGTGDTDTGGTGTGTTTMGLEHLFGLINHQGTTGTSTSGTGTGPGATGTDTGPIDPGGGEVTEEAPLGYDYVCSGHIPATTNKGRISGLENGVEYEFWLVAYDQFGNPAQVSNPIPARPMVTNDVWEQCSQDGENLCGQAGFCACRTEGPRPRHGWLWMGLIGGLGWWHRSRRAR